MENPYAIRQCKQFLRVKCSLSFGELFGTSFGLSIAVPQRIWTSFRVLVLDVICRDVVLCDLGRIFGGASCGVLIDFIW